MTKFQIIGAIFMLLGLVGAPTKFFEAPATRSQLFVLAGMFFISLR